jgi:hypothetical protein
MKTYLRMLVAILGISLASGIQAQSVGVKGGLNFANVLSKDDKETYSKDFKSLLGFHAGLTVDFPLSDMVSFQTGAILNTKGFKFENSQTASKISGSANLLYVDIPLHLKATFGSNDLKIFALAGPYVGWGLSGKTKTEVTIAGVTNKDEKDVKFGSAKDDDLKRLDYGVSIGAGIELNRVTIGATYNLGLANLAVDTSNGYKDNNRVLQISLGYKI